MSELLREHGFKFQKKYGQNFLTDAKIPRRISMECTDFSFDSPEPPAKKAPYLVLEIGPGAGILTKELALRFERVAAVEIDESLRGVLGETLKSYPNTEVFFGDIMDVDLQSFIEPRRTAENGEKLGVCVCANLPYYITTPIIMKLLEEYGDFSFITVMVQKEVAARLCSRPSDSVYGPITAQINLHGTVKRLFTVPSGCFFPRPKVDSAVIRIEPYATAVFTPEQIRGASALIKAAFSARRKTLANSLFSLINGVSKDELAEIIDKTLGLGRDVRGERLSAENFVALAQALKPYIA